MQHGNTKHSGFLAVEKKTSAHKGEADVDVAGKKPVGAPFTELMLSFSILARHEVTRSSMIQG